MLQDSDIQKWNGKEVSESVKEEGESVKSRFESALNAEVSFESFRS